MLGLSAKGCPRLDHSSNDAIKQNPFLGHSLMDSVLSHAVTQKASNRTLSISQWPEIPLDCIADCCDQELVDLCTNLEHLV